LVVVVLEVHILAVVVEEVVFYILLIVLFRLELIIFKLEKVGLVLLEVLQGQRHKMVQVVKRLELKFSVADMVV
jgi:hypothetical protein